MTIEQMITGIVEAIDHPTTTSRIVDAPAIARSRYY